MAVTVAKNADVGFNVTIDVDKKNLVDEPGMVEVLQNAFQQLRKETSEQAQAKSAPDQIAGLQVVQTKAKTLPS